MPTSPHHVRPDGFRIFLERPTLVAVCIELQQLLGIDTRPAPQAYRLVSDDSHRQHRWSPPTTSARSIAPSSCSRDPSPPQVCARCSGTITLPPSSVPIRSLFVTFRTRPHVFLLTLTMLPSIHLFCVHCWYCRSASSASSATQMVASYIVFSSTIRLRVLLQLPPRNLSLCPPLHCLTSDWTMCSVEQAALHTLASHLVHFKKLTVFQGCPTRCASLASFHRATHHGVQSPLALLQMPRFAIASSRLPFSLPAFVGDMCSPI